MWYNKKILLGPFFLHLLYKFAFKIINLHVNKYFINIHNKNREKHLRNKLLYESAYLLFLKMLFKTSFFGGKPLDCTECFFFFLYLLALKSLYVLLKIEEVSELYISLLFNNLTNDS